MVINNDGLTPVDQTKLVITKPKSTAAGIPAISSTIHSLKKWGHLKQLRLLKWSTRKQDLTVLDARDPEHRSSSSFVKTVLKQLPMKQ